jgi:hypothetical protein
LRKYTQSILNSDVLNDLKVIKYTRQQSVRRGLVLGNGFSLLLISIITANNMWEYFSTNSKSIDEFLILIFSSWGIAYVIFLWISFFVIAIRNIPGCGWTAIKVGLLKTGDVHICLDSVLNARQDMVQEKSRISVELLKTDGFKLWGGGLLGFLVIAYILTLDRIPLEFRLIIVGVFSSLYYIEDITIHEFSKYSTNLTGCGDYPRLLGEYLRGLRKRS